MAKTRAKNKAKSAKSKKTAPKKKPALKAKAARKPVKAKVAKKPAAKKAVAKKIAKPAAKKKVVARATAPTAPRKILPKATPMARPEKKPLAPAVDRALAQADVEGLISRLPPPVQPVVKTLRRLVLEAAPEASERLDDGSPAYFANGVFARIVPSEREVLVKFLRGGALPSAGELPGEGEARSISLTSLSEIKENVLRKLVREAVMLNMSMPPGAQA